MNFAVKFRSTIKMLVAATLLLAGSSAFAAAELGRDYKLLNPPQPVSTQKIEVLEFFFYGCSHCFDLHPHLVAWEKTMPKGVELIYVPTIFRDTWEPMARTFYALEAIGQVRALHDPLFKAWNVDSIPLNDEAQIAGFVATHGVDRAKFSAAYNSFSVQSKVVRANQMIRSYGISGTPSLVVDGKYLISGLQPRDALRVLDEVIEIARKEHAPANNKSKEKTAH